MRLIFCYRFRVFQKCLGKSTIWTTQLIEWIVGVLEKDDDNSFINDDFWEERDVSSEGEVEERDCDSDSDTANSAVDWESNQKIYWK